MPKILTVLADNQALFDATKEVLLKQFVEMPYEEGASDELLGQITRARMVGRKKVEEAFIHIASFKSVKGAEGGDNPGY